MDDFQFIIESPQHNEGHKKRPRLVTSCDNCRLKKIKCLQSGPSSSSSPLNKCEACKVAKISCRFRDRERYFAERSRAIAGSSATSNSKESSRERSPGERSSSRGSRTNDPPSRPESRTHESASMPALSRNPSYSVRTASRPASHSPRESASGVVGIDMGGPSSRYSSYSPELPHTSNSSMYSSSYSSDYVFAPPRLESPPYSSHSNRPSYYTRRNDSSLSIDNPPLSPLFDPTNLRRPHPRFMPHYIQVFFHEFAEQCPFMTLEDTLAQFLEGTLSSLIASCIAALAVRYSNIPELTVRGVQSVAETYSNNAKNILSSSNAQSVEALHALMLIAWSEYKGNRVSDFRTYIQMSMRMALDLGLSDDAVISMNPSEHERHTLRVTWTSIVQLHFFASSCKGSWSWADDNALTTHVYSDLSLVNA
ncbi:hypothetical protein PLICRDRAFT_695468 [Plicaturopsis crispa FD-325 SS-3]|nr:hypothetical protein PLICRDRAFT_695468 [Plicaturopsis crispa FD-325 SS-3]